LNNNNKFEVNFDCHGYDFADQTEGNSGFARMPKFTEPVR
jgi:hypothetical protein